MDPAGVTMLDSIKIYGKTKEQFGWPDEPPEDFPSASVNNACSPNLNQGNGSTDSDPATPASVSGTVLERYAPGGGGAGGAFEPPKRRPFQSREGRMSFNQSERPLYCWFEPV